MAAKTKPRSDEESRRLLAEYLASTAPASQSEPAPEPYDQRVMRRRGDGDVDLLHATSGDGSSGYTEETSPSEHASIMERLGYRWTDDNGYNATRQHVDPTQAPPGKLPFLLGGAETHAPVARPDNGMSDQMAKAAGWGASLRNPPEREPQVDVAMGKPQLVSRTPAAPPKRPEVVVSKAGQADGTSTLSRAMEAGRGGKLPPGLYATALQSPEVAAHIIASDDELLGAQNVARDRTFKARLARASAMVAEALSGAKYDRDAYSDLEGDASRPVSDLLQRRQQEKLAAGERSAAEAATYERQKDLRDFQYRQQHDKDQDTLQRDRFGAEQAWHREESQQRRLDRAESRAERMDRKKQGQSDIDERARLAREQKQGDRKEADIQKLGKLEDGASTMKRDLETVNSYIEKGGDLPGVGPIAGRLPDLLISDKGTELRGAAERLVQNLVYEKSGKSITPEEARRVMASRGMGPGQSEIAFKKGMQSIANEARDHLVSVEGSFRPEVVQERTSRGGVTSASFPGPAVAPTGRVKHTKNGEVWAEMDDGTARRVK